MLGRHSWPIRVDPGFGVVFIGPEGAETGGLSVDEPVVLGEEWELVYPAVPDYPPEVTPMGS